MKSLHRFFKCHSPFFTLIELLVVFSILSTVASMAVASMNSARNSAVDSRVKESLSSVRNQAQIYHVSNESYGVQATTTGIANCTGGVFGDPKIHEILSTAESGGVGPITCVATGDMYALSVPLLSNDEKSWCVNSLGYAAAITGTIANNECSPSASESVGTPGCSATGACPFTMSGSSCISYSATSSPSTCDYVARTSTCTDGAWDSVPFSQPTCAPACVSSGGCPVTDEGGVCVSYTSENPTGSCASASLTSTCVSALWSTPPHAYGTCSEGCAATGGCVATISGGSCVTYSATSVTSPATCESVATTSTCMNGTWDVVPHVNDSCALGCAATGGCSQTADGGTCVTYSSASVTSPATCASVSITSTCSNGSWGVAPYSNASCSVIEMPAGTGGSVTTNGNYKVHSFTGSGTFNVTTAGSFDVLIVGGGGGGAADQGGGGGAGRVIFAQGVGLSQGTYSVTVGSGGSVGGDASASSVVGTGVNVSAAGGVGGNGTNSPGRNTTGGSASGGGGSYPGTWSNAGGVTSQPVVTGFSTVGSITTGGNNGGNGYGRHGGGGGGAGSAGTNPHGGSGLSINITGTPTYYGGGGGGGGDWGGGNGGAGGGGWGASTGGGAAGAANTGGGGGGGGSGGGAGSTGGSGVVIIRYQYQ